MKTSDEPLATPMSKSVVKRLEAQGAPLATKAVQTCVKCGHYKFRSKETGRCKELLNWYDDTYCNCECVFSAPEAQTEREEVSVSAGGEPGLKLCEWCKQPPESCSGAEYLAVRCATNSCPVRAHGWTSPEFWNTRTQPAGEPSDAWIRKLAQRIRHHQMKGYIMYTEDQLVASITDEYNKRTRASAPSSEPVEYQDGDLEKFFGIDPDFTGNKSTSEYVDEIRGAAPSPEGGGSVGNGEKYVRSADVMTALDSVFASVNRQQIRGGEVGLMVYQRLSSVPEFTLPAQPLPTTTDAQQRALKIVSETNEYLADFSTDSRMFLSTEDKFQLAQRIASAISSTPSQPAKLKWTREVPHQPGAGDSYYFCKRVDSNDVVVMGFSMGKAWLNGVAYEVSELHSHEFLGPLTPHTVSAPTSTDEVNQVVTIMRQQALQWRTNVCLVPPTQYSVADVYEECAELILKCFNVEQEKQDLDR